MNSFFVYRNVKHSDALEEYTLKRLNKVEKYIKEDAQVHITFDKKGSEHICSVGIDGRYYFKSKKSTESMYDAVDLCVQSLKNTLSKDKDKCKSKWKRSNGFKSFDMCDIEDDCDYELLHTFDNLD